MKNKTRLLLCLLLMAACKKDKSDPAPPVTNNNNTAPITETNAAKLKKYKWQFTGSTKSGQVVQMNECFLDDFWTFGDTTVYIDAGDRLCPNGGKQVETMHYAMHSDDKTLTAITKTHTLEMEIVVLDSTELKLRYVALPDTGVYTDSFVPKK